MTTSLDFSIIETGNCKTLTVVDTSIYGEGQVIAEPTFTIHVPGYTDSVSINFMARKVNIFNSNNLGVSCTNDAASLLNLSDGIYKATYTIKPSTTHSIQKTFLRACNLQCKFENALFKLDILNCDDSKKDFKINRLKEIEFMILSAKAAANACNPKLAMDLYKKADSELDRLGARCK